MKCFNQISQSAIYREDNISVSITVCGGSYGGGSEVLVVYYAGMPSKSYAEQIVDERKENKQ